MATMGNRPATGARTGYGTNGTAASHDDWVRQTRVFLQPIAAPSILGLFGFSAATFMVAANLAGWYGTPNSGMYLFPFAAVFGGVAQFAAGMWGSFWIAYGILQLLGAVGVLTLPTTGTFPEFGYWFLCLAVITGFGMVAALGENLGITAVLATLGVGSALLAIHYLVGGSGWQTAGGWVLIASAFIACYTAGSMMIATTWGRTILPLGEYRKSANVPGGRPIRTLEYELGEPGVRHGQ
jgi:succinate-acetate transporter protein